MVVPPHLNRPHIKDITGKEKQQYGAEQDEHDGAATRQRENGAVPADSRRAPFASARSRALPDAARQAPDPVAVYEPGRDLPLGVFHW